MTDKNEYKCFVYVPWHPELGYDWPRICINKHDIHIVNKEYVIRRFLINGNNYTE